VVSITIYQEVFMKRIMAIIGSPRKGGNTEILIDKVIEGCKSRGNVEVEKFFIVDKNIKYCDGCVTCITSSARKCVIKDDMESILEQMERCDGFIFATPNHVRTVTAPMLNFLTRMLPLLEIKMEQDSEGNIIGGEISSIIENKKAAIVISQGDATLSSCLGFSVLERNFIDFKLIRVGEVISLGNTSKEAVKEKKNDLDAAFTLGRILAA
jgi:multimeric flavodoxin WrbA